VERLGIGGMGRGGVSHSISSGIKTINQEGVSKLSNKKSSDSFQSHADEWEIVNDSRLVIHNNCYKLIEITVPGTLTSMEVPIPKPLKMKNSLTLGIVLCRLQTKSLPLQSHQFQL
jgi:hypothetical protein